MKLGLLCWICASCFLVSIDAIYDGEYRLLKDYPFMAQIYRLYNEGLSLCGATILSEHWVVSAAHCFGYEQGTEEFQVRVGSGKTLEDGKLIDVEKVLVYSDCDPDLGYNHDIALIKLKNPIEFNEYQQPIHISKATPRVGENIAFLGFGEHHHGLRGKSLRSAETSIINDEDCYKSYEEKHTKNFFCASTQYMDLCFGDSGGPAVHDNKLVGVISQGCDYTEKLSIPSIIVKVANYYDWILKETGINYLD